jgi:hypothetical protein
MEPLYSNWLTNQTHPKITEIHGSVWITSINFRALDANFLALKFTKVSKNNATPKSMFES